MKEIILLGSTGSVGKNVLDVVRRYPTQFRIKALAAGENVSLLIEQAKEFKPDIALIGNKKFSSSLKQALTSNTKVLSGSEGFEELAGKERADIIFMAISGTQGLKPLIAAVSSGRTIALASKEPIVSAGMIVKKLKEKHSSRILPVDSEHSAIMQCLGGRKSEDINRLYITGSGGSLKDKREEEFDSLTLDEVLDHPKWNMGKKITVDSATLMNKGLEVIEARWLFDIPLEKIKVIIHPEAIIHSMVEFIDGTINASMFCPDMRFPILKALFFPNIVESDFPKVDFSLINKLSFLEPDIDRFPALSLAVEALKRGGTVPAVLNSSNEAAVNLFLEKKIKFSNIVKIIEKVIMRHKRIDDPSLDDVIDSERWAKEEVLLSC